MCVCVLLRCGLARAMGAWLVLSGRFGVLLAQLSRWGEGSGRLADILRRAGPVSDITLRYGSGPEQVADVWLPRRGSGRGTEGSGGGRDAGGGGAPLVVFLHGGFWRAGFDRVHVRPLAAALAELGYAVCVPEFRRVGQAGGGWPGTFDDVAAAVDVLPELVRAEVKQAGGGDADGKAAGEIAGGAVVLAGHSAGGHLALWGAARHRLPSGSRWRGTGNGRVAAVVALAPVSDLAACYAQGLGNHAAAELMGGGPEEHPDRYAVADPARLLPTGVRVRSVHGGRDDRVPCRMSQDYAARAAAAGDQVVLDELADTGHFEVIDPESDAWEAVVGAFRDVAPPSR